MTAVLTALAVAAVLATALILEAINLSRAIHDWHQQPKGSVFQLLARSIARSHVAAISVRGALLTHVLAHFALEETSWFLLTVDGIAAILAMCQSASALVDRNRIMRVLRGGGP